MWQVLSISPSRKSLLSCGDQHLQALRRCLFRVQSVSHSTVSDCNPRDCSLPGSSLHGILQERILKSIAIPFSKGSSLAREWTQVSCTAGRFFTIIGIKLCKRNLARSHQYMLCHAGGSKIQLNLWHLLLQLQPRSSKLWFIKDVKAFSQSFLFAEADNLNFFAKNICKNILKFLFKGAFP